MSDESHRGDRRSTALMALGSAAVLTVYSAGFLRTRAAANRITEAEQSRRPVPVSTAPAISTTPSSAPLVVPPPVQAPKEKTIATAATRPAIDTAVTPKKDSIVVAPAVVVAIQPTPIPLLQQPAPSPAPTTPAAKSGADSTRGLKDGVFSGWGTSRHGDLEATIEISGGLIIEAHISQCRTRYSCSVISVLPLQVVARQSGEVDRVSGATQSADAFYYAVVEALKKAK